jgi:hypothetical protein
VSGRRRKEELFDGALLLKPHEAVAEGGVAVETVGGNGGQRSHGCGLCAGRRLQKALGTAWAPLFVP